MKKSYDLNNTIPSYELNGSYKKIDESQHFTNRYSLIDKVIPTHTEFPSCKTLNNSADTIQTIFLQISVSATKLDSRLDLVQGENPNTPCSISLSKKSNIEKKSKNFLNIFTKFFSLNKTSFTNGVKKCNAEFTFYSDKRL